MQYECLLTLHLDSRTIHSILINPQVITSESKKRRVEDNLDKVSVQDKVHAFDITKHALPVYDTIKQRTRLCDDTQIKHSRSDHHIVTKKMNLISQPARHIDGNEEEASSPDLLSLQSIQQSNMKRKAQSMSTTLGLKGWRAKSHQSIRSQRKKTFRRDAIIKKPLHGDKYSMIPNSGLQEVLVCKLCRNGSIKMFCESTDVSAQKKRQQNSNMITQMSKMRLLLDKEFTESDISSALKDINEDASDFEVWLLDLKTIRIPSVSVKRPRSKSQAAVDV